MQPWAKRLECTPRWGRGAKQPETQLKISYSSAPHRSPRLLLLIFASLQLVSFMFASSLGRVILIKNSLNAAQYFHHFSLLAAVF